MSIQLFRLFGRETLGNGHYRLGTFEGVNFGNLPKFYPDNVFPYTVTKILNVCAVK